MPWGLAAGLGAAMAANRGAHNQRVARLRQQGKDDEADALDAQYLQRLVAMRDTYRQPPDYRSAYVSTFVEKVRVKLPEPELMRERDWWPWLVLEMWVQLWVTVV